MTLPVSDDNMSLTKHVQSSIGPSGLRARTSRCVPLRHRTRTCMSAGRTALQEMEKDGAFKRRDSVWRSHIKPGSEFPPEAGRYHLYISYACPWANRTLAALYLKGLEDVIGLSVCHPTWQRTRPDSPDDEHTGWAFASPDGPPFSSPTGHGSFPPTACIPDTVNKPPARFVRDLYETAKDTGGKYSVPVLWDKQQSTIVNNESSEILRMFNSEFQDLAKHADLDLYPQELRKEIDALNAWIYPNINNGVYRCGFATGQAAYEEAFQQLFDALDKVEGILAKQRYLAGEALTEADVRLFMTLIRFDHIYECYFKCNRNFIKDLPHTADYVRELYSIPGIGKSINMYHCKTHYYTSHPRLNHYAIVPVGPGAWYEEKPRDRHKLPGKTYTVPKYDQMGGPDSYVEGRPGLGAGQKAEYSYSYPTVRDPESLEDVPLVPGMGRTENQLRWGFIRKVWGIIAAQLVLTALVATVILAVQPVQRFVLGSLAFQLTFAILPLVGLIPLFIYARQHPLNLVLLGLWTACLSVGVGTACTLYQPLVVLEALGLTASIVVGLSAYTFRAVRKGHSFQRLGPILYTSLWALVVWSFLQFFFPPGPIGQTIFALLGTVLFSAYIVFDTENLIARHDLDDYIIASVSLYLDIINLFLKLLQLLNSAQRN